MQSMDITSSNVEKIRTLFPDCVTERKNADGNPELAVDFEKLQQELSDDIIGEGEERYQFTWPDKHELYDSTLVVIAFIVILALIPTREFLCRLKRM